ncbi:unnamed protein product [Ambrosiozyma monospora]|uniref:Unnamed protein product n=1 Tax=Ambrosiozyma monospora TaxID=43982 RepID=A0ACB5T7K1_AMBMO|nr:unnamed protein product [Ambrosiozyma monospora]
MLLRQKERRGRGRPKREHVAEVDSSDIESGEEADIDLSSDEVTPIVSVKSTRGRGRPKKKDADVAKSTTKIRKNSPRSTVIVDDEVAIPTTKGKRGRPRKEPETDGPVIKKRRGRPTKVLEIKDEDDVSSDDNDVVVPVIKKKRGRPGRPRKNPETVAEADNSTNSAKDIVYVSQVKRGRGRPKKNSTNIVSDKTKVDEGKVSKSHRPKAITQKIPMKNATVLESLQISMEDLNPIVSDTFHKKVKDIWKVGQDSKLKDGEDSEK